MTLAQQFPGSARVSRSRTLKTPWQRGARITKKLLLLVLGSAGCQPVAFGSLPNAFTHIFPIHTNHRLAACVPQHPR